MNKEKLRMLAYSIFACIALLILVDFILPGKIVTTNVVSIKTEYQQYYNAGGNHHNSYKVITDKHQFSVSKEFAKLYKTKEQIEYSVSPIFNEVNRYGLTSSATKTMYSLRFVSGLIIPLLALISLIIAYKYEYKVAILVVVLQIVLLGNFVFLMM